MIWLIEEFCGPVLHNRFKMPIGMIKLLRSLFDLNYSRLCISGIKSEKIPHLRGLPQGSSLSPILFNFYIDSLIDILEQENLMMDSMGIKSNRMMEIFIQTTKILFKNYWTLHINGKMNLE